MAYVNAQKITEAQHQEAVFEWTKAFRNKYPCLKLMYHIPNEGKRSNVGGSRLKRQGLKRGVPDICLPVSNGKYHSLYIELKRMKQPGVKASEEQKWWIKELGEEGHYCKVCFGYKEAIDVITNYLEGKV